MGLPMCSLSKFRTVSALMWEIGTSMIWRVKVVGLAMSGVCVMKTDICGWLFPDIIVIDLQNMRGGAVHNMYSIATNY